jgi:ABC-type glycerol-3-phosphate transport system substrate-binding protein
VKKDLRLVLMFLLLVAVVLACSNPATSAPAPAPGTVATFVWTDQTSSDATHKLNWYSIASSSDGTRLA